VDAVRPRRRGEEDHDAPLTATLVSLAGLATADGLTKLFLGSVSESMVSLLPCAVAVIRPGTFDSVAASEHSAP